MIDQRTTGQFHMRVRLGALSLNVLWDACGGCFRLEPALVPRQLPLDLIQKQIECRVYILVISLATNDPSNRCAK